jgi:hypothetical protein
MQQARYSRAWSSGVLGYAAAAAAVLLMRWNKFWLCSCAGAKAVDTEQQLDRLVLGVVHQSIAQGCSAALQPQKLHACALQGSSCGRGSLLHQQAVLR